MDSTNKTNLFQAFFPVEVVTHWHLRNKEQENDLSNKMLVNMRKQARR